MKTTNNFKSTIMAILTMAILTIMAASMTSCDKTEMDDITPDDGFCWTCQATTTATTPGGFGLWLISPITGEWVYYPGEPPTTTTTNSPSYVLCDQSPVEINSIIQSAYIHEVIDGVTYVTTTKCEKQ